MATPTIHYFIALGHHPIANTTTRSDEPGMNIANSAVVTRIFAGLHGKKRVVPLTDSNHRHSIAGSGHDRLALRPNGGAPALPELPHPDR